MFIVALKSGIVVAPKITTDTTQQQQQNKNDNFN